ncbi:TIGR02391 family protein [Streptomyces sp. NPDC058469]|uniref:TIGR02391 family protein n=1 Tax=Streptomyces sp. NPDC058469 TaxID=3346514 RepID=UPI003650B9B5
MPRPTGEEGHVLLDTIWAHFAVHHRWPSFDVIDRKLYASGQKYEEAVQQLCPALLRGLDPDISRVPQGTQELPLTIAGAANCTGAGSAIRVFLGMVRTAATIEPHFQPTQPDEQPMLMPVDMKGEPGTDPKLLTKETMFAAAELGVHEPCFRGGGNNGEELNWSLRFDRGIRPFADVQRLEDYWQIREQVIGPARTEADNRPFSNRLPEFIVAPTPTPTPAAPVSVAEVPETMSVTCVLHPLIMEVAAERFSSGFYYDAVRSAFQAVEFRVQTLVGVREVGEKLMGIALGKPGPMITVTRSTGTSLDSEQTGMQFLFKGAMGALRNPRMHGPDEKDARDEAEEMLVIASFLMRRLDLEDERRKAAAGS